VFGRLHNKQKHRAVSGRASRLSLFLLLLRQIISERHRALRRNPGPPRVWRGKNSGSAGCFSLFFAVREHLQQSRKAQYNVNSFGASLGESLHFRYDITTTALIC
jgi:hypothetical protein